MHLLQIHLLFPSFCDCPSWQWEQPYSKRNHSEPWSLQGQKGARAIGSKEVEMICFLLSEGYCMSTVTQLTLTYKINTTGNRDRALLWRLHSLDAHYTTDPYASMHRLARKLKAHQKKQDTKPWQAAFILLSGWVFFFYRRVASRFITSDGMQGSDSLCHQGQQDEVMQIIPSYRSPAAARFSSYLVSTFKTNKGFNYLASYMIIVFMIFKSPKYC